MKLINHLSILVCMNITSDIYYLTKIKGHVLSPPCRNSLQSMNVEFVARVVCQ